MERLYFIFLFGLKHCGELKYVSQREKKMTRKENKIT